MIDSQPNVNLMILGDFDESLIDQEKSRVILLMNENSVGKVLDQVMAIFEHYTSWYDRLQAALIAGDSLQQILDIGAEQLANPIALLDASMSLLIKAGELPADVSNTIWAELLSHGYSPVDLMPVHLRPLIDSRVINNEPPFVVQVPDVWQDRSWMISGVHVHGQVFGTFGATELYTPFTIGQLSLIACLKQVVETALERSEQFAKQPDDFANFISQLLAGYPVDPQIVAYQLTRQGWQQDTRFKLYCIGRPDRGFASERLDKYFLQLQAAVDARIFVHEGLIVAIEHIGEAQRGAATDYSNLVQRSEVAERYSSRYQGEVIEDMVFAQPTANASQQHQRLLRFLKVNELCAGVSLPFTGFGRLRNALTQARLALSQAGGVNQTSLLDFGQCFEDCLVGLLSRSIDLESIVHPDILRLWQSSLPRDRENIISLGVYLLNGCNLSATAKQLHVHRNTLDYRLQRISSDLGIELSILGSEQLFLLQFSCLIVQRL
ncbi:MAG: helix-turn-helix domain-containing protein [Coriobacteriales bacterium]|nr:helix-turn-helix domain-containing protein [Coriobacteriales bacterium]